MIKQILVFVLLAVPAFGQLSGNAQLVLFPGTPTGSCTSRQLALNQSSGSLYACINRAWQAVAGGGGGPALLGCTTPSTGNLLCDVSVQGGSSGNVGMLTMPYSASGLPSPPTTAEAAIAPDATGHLFASTGNSAAFVAIGSGGGGSTAGVSSFASRTGAVVPQASDYSSFFAPIGAGGGATATALQFSQTTFNLSSTAPTSGECLAVNQGTVVGVPCGGGVLGGVISIE